MLGLTEKERKVLAVAQFAANTSVPKLAKAASMREHTFRYAFQSLMERGVLHFSPVVNVNLLGYQQHSMQFSLSTRDAAKMQAARQYLCNSKFSSFVIETGGEFQFAVTLITRSLLEVDSFVEGLSQAVGHEIFQKEFASHLETQDFRADYLYGSFNKLGHRAIQMVLTQLPVEIDALDHEILRGIVASTFKSKTILAREKSIPLTTLESRISRLEKRNIIIGYRYLIATHLLGAQRMWISLVVKGPSQALTKRFFNFCQQNTYARYASRALGAWDLDVGYDSLTIEGQSQFPQYLYEAFSAEIADVRVTPIFKFLKVSSYPF